MRTFKIVNDAINPEIRVPAVKLTDRTLLLMVAVAVITAGEPLKPMKLVTIIGCAEAAAKPVSVMRTLEKLSVFEGVKCTVKLVDCAVIADVSSRARKPSEGAEIAGRVPVLVASMM